MFIYWQEESEGESPFLGVCMEQPDLTPALEHRWGDLALSTSHVRRRSGSDGLVAPCGWAVVSPDWLCQGIPWMH